MFRFLSLIVFIFGFLLESNFVNAQERSIDGKENIKVYNFKIDDVIGPPMWRRTKNAINEATAQKADLIFIEMNTYGGAVDAADSIRTKILNSPIPVFVLIENNAASAGALISLACDSIYMMPGSTIGAATVVDQSGAVVPDKYQSYMRKKMRATAEQKGRNPDIAEAMVDPDKYIKGISDSGKVVTLTTMEAIEYGFCDAQVKTMEEALARANIKSYTIHKHKETRIDKIIGWLINPAISGILVLIIIGGLYFELQTPGLGFPIVASLIATVVYFAPLYLEGLAENWEILMFIVGVLLLAAEVFVIPGFGIAGISGLVLIVFGLALALVGNVGFDFEFVPPKAIARSFGLVIITAFGALIGSIVLSLKLLNTHLFGQFVLNTALKKEDKSLNESENIAFNIKNLIGEVGTASTTMLPSGRVIIKDEMYEATAVSGFVEKGAKIQVVKTSGNTLVIKAI